MVISWICLNLNIVYVIITKMVKIRDSTKPWSPFIHIDRRNSFTLDLRKQGKEIHCPDGFTYDGANCFSGVRIPPGYRSVEHTSELQSRGHLVCRLLLDKNK